MNHPNVRRVLTLLAFGVGVFLLATAPCAGEKVGDIDVAVQPLPNKESRPGTTYATSSGTTHGYIEYRVQLKNSSPKDHVVHLRYPGDERFSRISHGVVAARTVRVAGGQEVSVSLFQPPVEVANETMEVRVEGVRESGLISVGTLYGGHGYRSGPNPQPARAAVLLSRSVPQDFRDRGQPKAGSQPPTARRQSGMGPAAPAANGQRVAEGNADESDIEVTEEPSAPQAGASSITSAAGTTGTVVASGPVDQCEFFRSEVPVSQWSANWLGYSCYDVILLTERDAAEMPAQTQLAIRRYLECGGTLLVHGQSVPAAFSQGGAADATGGYTVGFGYAAATLQKSDPKSDSLISKLAARLEGSQSDWDVTYNKLIDSPVHIYHADQKPGNLYELLVKEATVPVRGLFVLVLLFGLGIGPVNIWLLSRHKRRIWLWWNVPVISLLTCLAVFCYASFSEGWTGYGKVASLTLLDERFHRATTIGYLSYYCPLTPSAGAWFGVDTDAALLENQPDWRRYYGPRETSLRFVDWSSDQQLASGWVTARVPAYFQIRKNEDRRERLTVQKKADGSLAVVNALGADIRRLCLADAAGRIFEGHDIPAGAERTLVAAAGKTASGKGPAYLRGLFTNPDWLGVFRRWDDLKDDADVLAPGSYIAVLDKSPFVETPLEGVDSEDTFAMVYGICKGSDDGR